MSADADKARPERVALDLLGGDRAPDVVVEGAVLAATERPDLRVVLVGPPDVAGRLLAAHDATDLVDVVAASEAVAMGEDPVRAVRAKRDATVRVAARLVRDGLADATVSVGSTGAAVVAAVFTFGRLPGVTRPALAVTIPAEAGPVVLLDAGASTDCTADLLAQFALTGAAFARARLGIADPRVGLLSIGTEPGKGDALRKEAFTLLAGLPVQFVGNVESSAVTAGGVADVVVADGFTGNVLLKGIEGLWALTRSLVSGSLPDPAAALSALDPLAPERFGGVLLGVDGVAVIGHGASGPRAVATCVTLAADVARDRLVPRVAQAVADLVVRHRRAAGLASTPPAQGR